MEDSLKIHVHRPRTDFHEAFVPLAQSVEPDITTVQLASEADIIVVDGEECVEEVNRANVWIAVVGSKPTRVHAKNVFFTDDCGKIIRFVRHVKRELSRLHA